MAERLEKIGRMLLGQRKAWCPLADVYRVEGEWVVKLELPGIKLEDLEISLEDNRVSIQGQRRDCSIQSGQVCYSMEISYDQFDRTLELPFKVDEVESHVLYRDGMLFIHLKEKEDPHE
jgi:HSP20 family protein